MFVAEALQREKKELGGLERDGSIKISCHNVEIIFLSPAQSGKQCYKTHTSNKLTCLILKSLNVGK
jgi:hypothetical protein